MSRLNIDVKSSHAIINPLTYFITQRDKVKLNADKV